jgi:molecular chaperone DnaK
LGGVRTALITRNTTVPTSKTETFSTAADSQTSVAINILQGEREMASDNKSLGQFMLDGIPPAPRGMPQIEVIFDIDSSGILNVTAKDKATSKSQSIKITGSTGLDKTEVEKMTKDAESHADEDKLRKEQVEARNVADNLCYTAEKSLRDLGDKVQPTDKKDIEEKVKSIRDVLATASSEDLKQRTQELSLSLQKIGQAMYDPPSGEAGQQSQGTPQSGGEPTGEPKKPDEGEVKEGEVVE